MTMAAGAPLMLNLLYRLSSSRCGLSLMLFRSAASSHLIPLQLLNPPTPCSPSLVSLRRPHLPACFSSSSSSSSSFTVNSPASFDWSSDDDDEFDIDGKTENNKSAARQEIYKSKLPPPYDPFSKKPVVEEPRDPSNLQEIFHRMRTQGLTNYAIKMFDALSKDGLTHEALELFAVIKDKGTMPDVVSHTAVLEAYANAGGHSKDAIRTYQRMLASGVAPNAYTFSVLIKGLAKDGRLSDSRKYLLEMMAKAMRPNVSTYLAVLEAYLREQKVEEARSLLQEMIGKGFRPDEKEVRENLSKRGQVFRNILSLLFGK